MHFVRAAVARLGRASRKRVIESVGISETLLAAPQARVPAQTFSALWLAVSREIDDEFFGLDSRRMKVGSFALLCHAVLGSANLDRAVKHMLRGFRAFLDDVEADLTLDGPFAVLAIENRIADVDARRFADETFLIMVHGLMCWLAGQRVPLESAAFAFSRPDHSGEYTLMYSDRLEFDAPQTAIRFDARLLGSAVVQRPETLKVFLRTAPQSVFLKFKNEASMTARLRRHLRRFVGKSHWPLLDQIARDFHMSETTLRRRLDAEITSYQGLKDEVRRDAAIHYLCSTDLGVSDVGALVGFHEVSAFRRAFKAWSGVQPSEYRRRSTGPPSSIEKPVRA